MFSNARLLPAAPSSGTFRSLRTLPLLGASLALLVLSGCNRDPAVRKQRYLDSGIRFEKDGKLREAAIQFQNALKVDRNFAPAHYELGMADLKMKSFAAGYHELLVAITLDPSNVKARIQVANIMLAANLPDRAMEQVKAVQAIDARNPDAFSLLANIAAQKSDPDEARKQIQQALAIDPKRSDFHTTQALLEIRDPKTEPDAEAELGKAITLDSTNVTAHLLLSSLLEMRHDTAGAVREAEAAIVAAPKDLLARRDLAGIYLRAGDRPHAEQTLRQASADLADTPEGASILSDFYLSRGETGAAEGAYKELVDKNPKSFELRYAYARILVLEHKDEEAGKIAKQLDKEEPKTPEVAVLNASLLLNAGKVDDAFDLLQKASKTSPDNLHLLLVFARVAVLKGDANAAEVALRDAAKLSPGNIEVQRGLADVANRKQDYSMLAQVAESTLSKNPSFPDAFLWRGTAEANLKQFDRAEADFRAVLARQPNDMNALVELGQILVLQKKTAEGLALFERAAAANPNAAAPVDRIVRYDFANNQPDKAVERIKQALDKSPKNVAFMDELAAAEFSRKNFAAARDAAGQVLGLAPADKQAIDVYARSSQALGDTDSAIAAWKKWAEAHPADGGAASEVAQYEEAKGDNDQAFTYYWKALALEPGQVVASNNLAYMFAEKGQNLDTALRLAQDARAGDKSKSPSTADTLAWVYFARGRYLSARDLLEEAVKADPSNPSFHYHLGMTYRKLGDKTNAAVQLKKAETLAPESKAGKQAATALAEPA